MNGKLRSLDQMAKLSAVASGEKLSPNVLQALQSAISADAEEAIRNLQEQLAKAEKRCEQMQAECCKMQDKLESALKCTSGEVHKDRLEGKSEMNRACADHKAEINLVRQQLAAAIGDIENERRLRVKAEADCAAETKLRARLEQLVTALQADKGKTIQVPEVRAIMPEAQPMKPMRMAVTQRDQHGRIVAVEIIPNT